LLLVGVALLMAGAGCKRDGATQPAQGPITYNKHIAPLLFTHCAPCHRPGQSAPFSLLTFADAEKRAKQIVAMTGRRYMPPWLPDGPIHQFVGDRRLTDGQIDLLRRWLNDGVLEGTAKDLPTAPIFQPDWPLGPPDLVVKLPEAYAIAAEGTNVYRIFVLPLGLKERRYVRAMDFRPHSAAIHHALFAFDRSGTARRSDARDTEPGFASFTMPDEAETPPHFLGWHPGKQPTESPPGLAWPIESGADLVLQVHIQPSGRAEKAAPEVAFYFTSQPPTNTLFKLPLSSIKISIPAGAARHVVRAEFPVAGDCELLAAAPHAHFLAKEIIGAARLPDGTRRTLLHIGDWDFNWQDSYRYAKPVFLPAGTVLEMEIAYDNSAANPRNPYSPPREIKYGLDSTDEMAVLNFQVLPRNPQAAQRIAKTIEDDTVRYSLEYAAYLLERNPNNERARVSLARSLYLLGQLEQAANHVAIARKLDPLDDDAALLDGIVSQFRNQREQARAAFEDCIRLNPNHPRAHGCLAVLAVQQGWTEVAEMHLREALRIDPADTTARDMLRQIGGAVK
jgi:hypothetical protein